MLRLLAPFVFVATLLLPTAAAQAHPLDVYLQASYVTLAPSTVTVELDLSPGVLIAPAALVALDPNRDEVLSTAETTSYAESVLGAVEVSVDDRPLTLRLSDVEAPTYLAVKAGYGTLRVFATATGAPSSEGGHTLAFRNGFSPKGSTYQANAFVERSAPVALGRQQRSASQQQTTVTYRIDPAVSAAGERTTRAASSTGTLAGYLQRSSMPVGVVLLALGAAALLGALHALTPGHAKTLMAAYLVGSGGTTRNALTLGAVVTVTHTASVIGIGLIALLASDLLVPGLLVPALEIASGLLVVVLGVRLLRQRFSSLARAQDHEHAHERELVLSGGGQHVHEHGGHSHTHALPAEGITPRSLVAMGVSGGLVPCPEALGVMIVAVGVNRTVLGLALILSFSVGLAAVLMGLGVLLVRSRSLVRRFERVSGSWLTVLPKVSAAVVTVLGLALLTKGAAGLA